MEKQHVFVMLQTFMDQDGSYVEFVCTSLEKAIERGLEKRLGSRGGASFYEIMEVELDGKFIKNHGQFRADLNPPLDSLRKALRKK